jgi:hypothetical protein
MDKTPLYRESTMFESENAYLFHTPSSAMGGKKI